MDKPVDLIGYHLTFDAEFTSAADMSQFSNTFINGDRTLWPNKEAEYYTDYKAGDPSSSYAVQGGALSIKAQPGPTPFSNLTYTSGLLSTHNTFAQNQGYFEIRAQTPANKGFWSAFWLLNPGGYPEIDVLEQPNTGKSTEYWTHTSTPTDSSGGYTDVGVDVSKGFHSYGFMWTADTIQYTFDGHYIGYAHVTPPALENLKLYMLANLAVGAQGSWPGVPNAGDTAELKIDYIRAFSKDSSVPAVAQAAISSPDGVDTTPKLMLPPPPVPAPIGTGPDTLVLLVAEDEYNGDAQFTVSIDGVQQGATLTAVAKNYAGQTQAFTFRGAFGSAAHNVSVNFLNNAGDAGGDRNLFVKGATINGVAIPGGTLNQYSGGQQSFSFVGTAAAPDPVTPTNPAPVTPMDPAPTPPDPMPTPQPPLAGPAPVISPTVGSGLDVLTLQVSEDAYNGDAQFTISVNGVQQGGTMTATASNTAGQTQAFTVLGNFGIAQHRVTVNFLNDAYGGAGLDRNLYVKSATLNGAIVPNAVLSAYAGGPASFSFTGDNAASAPPAPAPLSVGSGPDKLVLQISEDAYNGDAQFTVSVDGVQQGGILTATASEMAGQTQALTILGSFASTRHTVAVNFLNDAYGGAGLDRNLYVKSATLNGAAVPGAMLTQMSAGPQSFAFTGDAAPPPPPTPPISTTPETPVFPALSVGAGPDKLILKIAEDAYNGDAQFTVSVDGVQQGGVLTAKAANAAGQTQDLVVLGSFGTARHNVAVNFLNDAYGGAGLDRNLYVKSATLNGAAVPGATLTQMSGGPQSFGFTGDNAASAPPPVAPEGQVLTVGAGSDKLVLQVAEDAYNGHAQFTVSVDGVQQGGVMSATASNAAGASQALNVLGSFGKAPHIVTVNFLNDDYGGQGLDRNFYVKSAAINGQDIAGAALNQYSGGPQNFNFVGNVSNQRQIEIGTGADSFLVKVSEDAYLGDARFTFLVDGVQQGGVQTTNALHATGDVQAFAINGAFGPEAHTLTVNFLNDAWGGSPSLDRNLYVDNISYNGVVLPGGIAGLGAEGPRAFLIPASGGATPAV